MKKKIKLTINTILILFIFIFGFLFFMEYNDTSVNTIKNDTSNTKIQLEQDKSSESFSISMSTYLNNISHYSKLFTQILNKYNLNTIMTKKDNNSATIYETSILLESLNIPNGFKTTYINIDNNEILKTYISLIDTLKDNSWNRTLTINISSDSSILTFNSSNYPEIFELLDVFAKNINIQTLESNVNNIINNNSSDILNEFYSISKYNDNNSTFLQISIYLNNGVISDK